MTAKRKTRMSPVIEKFLKLDILFTKSSYLNTFSIISKQRLNLASDWIKSSRTSYKVKPALHSVWPYFAYSSFHSRSEQHRVESSASWCAWRQACQSTVVDAVGGLQPSPRGCREEQTREVQGAEMGWWVRWVSASSVFEGFEASCYTDGRKLPF